MSPDPLPVAWQRLTERAGVRPTHRGIADAAGVSVSTVLRLVSQGRTSADTVRAIAAALRVDAARVRQLAQIPQSDEGPWEPPEESQWLDPRQRAALDELIRTIVAANRSVDAPSRHVTSVTQS